LSEAIEGQIAEICRDVAVGVKRMRQLQQQIDELRMVIREWVRESNAQEVRAVHRHAAAVRVVDGDVLDVLALRVAPSSRSSCTTSGCLTVRSGAGRIRDVL
jgi:hypothetical protein